MGSVLKTPGKPAAGAAEGRDPAQRQQGQLYLQYQRHPPPGAWTDNRLAQAQHYTGTIFLALSAVQEAMAAAAVWPERRKRRDRVTFGPGGAAAAVKALSPDGGAGNDEDYAPVHDHPLADILAQPNPNETVGSMLGYLTLQWGLTGNAPLWLVPGAGHGRPVQLYPLVEALLQPAFGPSEYYPEGAWHVMPYYPTGMGWTYGTLATRMLSTTTLPGTEVRKLKAPHPLTRSDGYSPLTACGVQFDIMEAIDVSRHSAFQQGAQTGTLVYIPGLGQDGADRVAADLRERWAGPANARKVGVASSPPGATGEFKVERDPPPREMDYTASWEQATRVVLAAFGEHAAVAGLKDTAGYAELYAAQMQVYARLSGLGRQWGDFFTTHLARPWSRRPGEYRVKVRLPKPRNEEEYQRNLLSLGQQGGALVNEVRGALDLKPVRFGDLPLALYLKKVEGVEFPQAQQEPSPAAAALPAGEKPPPPPTPARAGTGPTAGAPPQPENPAAERSLPARPVGKARPHVRPALAELLTALSAGEG